MKKRIRIMLNVCFALSISICLIGCSAKTNTTTTEEIDRSIAETEHSASATTAAPEETTIAETEKSNKSKPEETPSETMAQNTPIIETDLIPSDGLEFESNGDGTCTLVSIGICKDNDLVIPATSPEGDLVTLIEEYAFYSLENVNSVTFINANYEIDENAFSYGEFSSLTFMGGNPIIKKSAFSNSEDLKSITFADCQISVDEYGFYSCGKDSVVTFSRCNGFIDENAFSYADMLSLSFTDCDLELEKSAFSDCEDLEEIIFENSTINANEYAFYSCGDSADVKIINSSTKWDNNAFSYSSFASLTITGSDLEANESAFSDCEDLTTVSIDCSHVFLGEYAFYGCEDLTHVSICENSSTENQIEIDDAAFQYCKRLESVVIGNGSIELGEYAFSGCPDNLVISIGGKTYSAEMIEEGIK